MQERFEYLDIAKGIGIIMVVLHHTSGAGSVPNIFISSFHMPLFFIISGLCFNELRYASFADYFRRKTRVLLWPLIAFTLLVYFASCLCGTDFYTLDKLASGHLPMAYWFVWVLYLTELIYYGCCRMTRNFLVRCLLLAFFLFLSLLLRYKDVSFPMSNHALFAALLFYGIGAVIRPFINRLLSINILQYGGGTAANIRICLTSGHGFE